MIETQLINVLVNQGVLVVFFLYAINKWDKLTDRNIKTLEKVAVILERNEKLLRKLEKSKR